MEKTTQKRYHMLDALRGVSVLSMVAFHFCYDWMVIAGKNPRWPGLSPVVVWQQSICWLFILLAGASVRLSRSPAKGGVVVLGCGLIVSAVTLVFMPSEGIWFGILHFIGLARLLVALLLPLLKKVPPAVGLAASLGVFFPAHWLSMKGLLYGLPGFWFGRTGIQTMEYKWWLAALDKLLAPLRVVVGLPPAGFASGDYFALIPWLFLFLAGYFAWPLVKDWQLWQKKLSPLCAVGRHSLVVYMLHQPICYAIVWLVFMR